MDVLNSFSLAGKVALITGGAGIAGRQMTRALAEAGAHTFVAARNEASLAKLKSALTREGLSIETLCYDQGDEASILRMRDAILAKAHRIDVLVNNAVTRPMKHGHEDSGDTFAESMQINATGMFLITRAVGDRMAEQGSGSIINIGSIQGVIGPDPAIYRGTSMNGWVPDYYFHKGGLVNFTRYIASYYGRFGVRCNCLSPGGIETEQHLEGFKLQYSERTFLGRLANETDLKGPVVFLASDASAYITGVNLLVDGGYTAK